MVIKTTGILNNEKDVIQAFGMSKQLTIQDKSKKGREELNKLNFTEFLEFICRIA
jgi:hypothetical protein